MESRWLLLVIIVSLLAGFVGGVLSVALSSGSAAMRMGMGMGPMMMSGQAMVVMQRQMLADPSLRQQMLEMHREMHEQMERR